jgi:hypothetical protein
LALLGRLSFERVDELVMQASEKPAQMQTKNGSPVDGAGFHQSWFPVTLSRELGGGAMIGVDLLARSTLRDPLWRAV